MFSARQIALIARTVAVSLLGGIIAGLAGVPSPWLIGPMILTALASGFGMPALIPSQVQVAASLLIGVSLGSGVSPDVLQHMATWPVTLGLLLVCSLAGQAACQLYFQKVCGWDLGSAFFGSVPGAFPMVIAMSAVYRADLRLVVIAQSMRIFLLLAVLPVLIVAIEGTHPQPLPAMRGGYLDLAVLMIGALIGFAILARLRLPAAALLGAMAASALFHGTGISQATLPPIVLLASFAVMGAASGSRFGGTSLAQLKDAGLAAAGGFLVSLAVTGVFVAALVPFVDMPLPQIILAFAPGGTDAMSSLALILHLDSAFVVVHQLARFIVLSVTLPIATKLMKLAPD